MNSIKVRKNIRLKRYDYSQVGYYFITICTKNRECILSKIKECRGEHFSSVLTYEGKIVNKHINEIGKKYFNIVIDEYIVMPNHIHIILIIKSKNSNNISIIIQQLKGAITKELGYSIWQKLFYEHIIRKEKEYLTIKEYIKNNPENWKKDKYY